VKRLLQIGFEQVGVWRIRGDQLALELTRMAGQRNVLYAFVHGGAVLYVGKTTGTGHQDGRLSAPLCHATNQRPE
jgi:hypothetical protein